MYHPQTSIHLEFPFFCVVVSPHRWLVLHSLTFLLRCRTQSQYATFYIPPLHPISQPGKRALITLWRRTTPSQKRIPQLHCCDSQKNSHSTYVIHPPSICPSVAPCVSKSNNHTEKLTKNSYSLYTGNPRTILITDITLTEKMIGLDKVTWKVP